jgi:hypothetical protein
LQIGQEMDSFYSFKNSKKITLVGITYEGEDTNEDEHEGSPTNVLESLFSVDCLPCLELEYFNFTKLPTHFCGFKYLITLYLSFIHT